MVHLGVFADQLQYPTDALLDATEIWAQRHLAPMLIFTPFRASPFPIGLFFTHLGRRLAVFWAMWFHQHWVGGATLDTHQGYTQKAQPWNGFAIQGGKNRSNPWVFLPD